LIKEADLWRDDIAADDLIIPYRNLLLLSAGAAFAASVGATALYSAYINSNHAREIDATKEFLDNLSTLFSAVGGVTVSMPFREKSKSEVAVIGLELNAPIGLTYSCQASASVHCGACPNCVDRIAALKAASRHEMTQDLPALRVEL
jgi:7-cyano-7-deazaguanine synthase